MIIYIILFLYYKVLFKLKIAIYNFFYYKYNSKSLILLIIIKGIKLTNKKVIII